MTWTPDCVVDTDRRGYARATLVWHTSTGRLAKTLSLAWTSPAGDHSARLSLARSLRDVATQLVELADRIEDGVSRIAGLGPEADA